MIASSGTSWDNEELFIMMFDFFLNLLQLIFTAKVSIKYSFTSKNSIDVMAKRIR